MSSSTRNTFQRNRNYKRVVIQKAQPVLDSELNELQDNIVSDYSEGVRLAHTTQIAAYDGANEVAYGQSEGFGSDQGWRAYAAGTPAIFLKAGTIFVDGLRLVLERDLDLSTVLTWPGPVPADTYGIVYMDVTFAEVDSTVDPLIATSQIGETSVRTAVSVTFQSSEGASFAAAYAGIVPIAAADTARIWAGNTSRVYLCRYLRLNGTVNINTSDIVSLTQAPITGLGQMFAKTFRSAEVVLGGGWTGAADEGGGNSDGMIVWDVSNGRLVIGVANDEGTADAYRTGLATVAARQSPKHLVASTTTLANVQTGGGAADGTPITQNAVDGFGLFDGMALGWLTLNPGSPDIQAGFVSGDSFQAELISASPAPATPPSDLIVQNLTVTNFYNFQRDAKHSFVLCHCVGNDLIWYNGHITRGILNRKVIDEPFAPGKANDVVIAAEGSTDLSDIDAVERALEFLTDGAAVGFGNGRSVNIRLRRGSWALTRKNRRYGTTAELAAQDYTLNTANNALLMKGDGPGVTNLTVRSSATVDANQFAAFHIVAGKVKLKDFTIAQDNSAASRYALYIEANEVELENMDFSAGGVWIKADIIRVKNCKFRPENSTNYNLVKTYAANHWVAQCLKLQNRTNTAEPQHNWLITGCSFRVTKYLGTHASVVLETDSPLSSASVCKILRNTWYYSDTTTNCARYPSIQIQTKGMSIFIRGNHFNNATGVERVGNNVGDWPLVAGNVAGSPMQWVGATGGVDGGQDTSGGNKLVACAYISCTYGRARDSKLVVENNFFDLSHVGANGVVAQYCMWGGMICMFNETTLGGTSDIYANITFRKNTLKMGIAAGLDPWATDHNIATWGFYLAPMWHAGDSVNNLIVENVRVYNNDFDIGGDAANRTWRSILSADIGAFPADLFNYLTDSTYLVGIVLKNGDWTLYTNSGRWAVGVEVKDNNVIQQTPGGVGAMLNKQIPLDRTTGAGHTRWWNTTISLALGAGPYNSPGAGTTHQASEGAAAFFAIGTGQGQFYAPKVSGNTIITPIYQSNLVDYAGHVSMDGIYAGRFADNYVYGADTTSSKFVGVLLLNSIRLKATGNTFKTDVGAVATLGTNYFTDNNVVGCVVNHVGMTDTYTGGAGTGDNFA